MKELKYSGRVARNELYRNIDFHLVRYWRLHANNPDAAHVHLREAEVFTTRLARLIGWFDEDRSKYFVDKV